MTVAARSITSLLPATGKGGPIAKPMGNVAPPPPPPAPDPAPVADAKAALKLLPDPRYTNWPGILKFLSGMSYKDVEDRPIEGAGSMDKPLWLPHVRQGPLGDCWFMGTQAAIALADREKFPLGVRRVDGDTVAVKYGGGEVAIGDKLLVRRNGKLAFARQNKPHFEATWPVYYEKVAASEMGSYQALAGGWPHEAMRMILGKEPQKIDRPGDMFDYMKQALNAKLPVAVTSQSAETKRMEELGIHGNHTYAVRKMIVKPDNGKAADIVAVKLWNPWGREHPKVIAYSDFEKYFDSITTSDEYFKWGGVRTQPPA